MRAIAETGVLKQLLAFKLSTKNSKMAHNKNFGDKIIFSGDHEIRQKTLIQQLNSLTII